MFFRTFFFFLLGGVKSQESPKHHGPLTLSWRRKIRGMDSDVNAPRKHWPMEALRRSGGIQGFWCFFWGSSFLGLGGLIVGGDVLRGCRPFFFPGAVFNLCFFGGGILMFWVVLFFSVCIFELQSLPVSWLIFGKNVPRPGKATSDYSDMWGGGVLSAEETCAVCVGSLKRCRLIHPLTWLAANCCWVLCIQESVGLRGPRKGGSVECPRCFFFKGGSGKRVVIFKQLLWAGLMRKTVRHVTKAPLTWFNSMTPQAKAQFVVGYCPFKWIDLRNDTWFPADFGRVEGRITILTFQKKILMNIGCCVFSDAFFWWSNHFRRTFLAPEGLHIIDIV